MFLVTLQRNKDKEHHVNGIPILKFKSKQTLWVFNETKEEDVIKLLKEKYGKVMKDYGNGSEDDDANYDYEEEEKEYNFAELVLKSLEKKGEWVNLECRWDHIFIEEDVMITIEEIKFGDEFKCNTITYNWRGDAH
jgi:hypothetical protein